MKPMITLFEQSTEFTLQSARRIAETNARAWDRMLRQQADLAAHCLDVGTRGLELMSKAKGYQDLLSGQGELLRESGERGLDALRQSYTLASEIGTVYGELAYEGIKLAREHAAELVKETH